MVRSMRDGMHTAESRRATGPVQRYFAGLSRNTFLLATASLFADISTEMLYPVLPVFLTQTLKASGTVVGVVDGFAQATQNIVQGFSGTLSDKLQKRKSVALAGYLLAAIAKPLMGLATVWQGVFAARLLDRLGAGARSAPRDALIASSVDEDNRGRAFGLEGAGDNAGAFLGPLLAALLLYTLRLDMRSIFFLAVIPGLTAFMMVLLVKENDAAVAAKSKLDTRVRQFPTDYWKYLLATALFGIGNSSNAFLIFAEPGRRSFAGNDHPDLCGLQPRCGPDILSGGLPFRQMGPEECAPRLVRDLSHRLSWFCADRKCRTHSWTLYLLRAVPRDFSRRRQGIRFGLRTGRITRQRHRLVQHDGWIVAAGGQRRCGFALGSHRPCGRILLWSDLRDRRHRCSATVSLPDA